MQKKHHNIDVSKSIFAVITMVKYDSNSNFDNKSENLISNYPHQKFYKKVVLDYLADLFFLI